MSRRLGRFQNKRKTWPILIEFESFKARNFAFNKRYLIKENQRCVNFALVEDLDEETKVVREKVRAIVDLGTQNKMNIRQAGDFIIL